jgi:aminoglycoside/choline kinase family phosphotransferase
MSISFTDPARQAAFSQWLAMLAPRHALLPKTLQNASADASFRRYFRLSSDTGASYIVMDAPPEHENCQPFVHVARLMHEAGLKVPQILDWNEPLGFMLLTDLGQQTLLEVLNTEQPDTAPDTAFAHFDAATSALVRWQLASRAGELPPYDEALLRREVELFPDWYCQRHLKHTLSESERAVWQSATATLLSANLASPQVYVHRDYMPRNLMVVRDGSLGILDFQDAVMGPITYDIASLMRDAFISWPEDVVMDHTIRYWDKARKASLPVDADFAQFWQQVEWMGLQRHLKVMGIFARINYRDGKPKYLADTPRFSAYVHSTLTRYNALAPLARLFEKLESRSAGAGYYF